MNNSLLMIKRDLILALCLRETESVPLFSQNLPLSFVSIPVSPSSSLSAGVSLLKCLIVRCHIFTEMRGKDPPAVLISCNAFLFSALITVGDNGMLSVISFVSCQKCSVSLSSVFHPVIPSFCLRNMHTHVQTDTWLAWLSQFLRLHAVTYIITEYGLCALLCSILYVIEVCRLVLMRATWL